jgi:hypothetical protein
MRLSAALLLMVLPAAAAERPKVDIACIPGGRLVYDCTFVVRDARTERPIDHVDLIVDAETASNRRDLPSVRAPPAGGPGTYKARLALTAYGDWTLRLRLSGTVTDQLLERLRFEDGRPAQRR